MLLDVFGEVGVFLDRKLPQERRREVGKLARSWRDPDLHEFEYGLDVVLDGLARVRDTA
jgi:hypothetical protein